jgi:D-galactarolactone cycloisomerase
MSTAMLPYPATAGSGQRIAAVAATAMSVPVSNGARLGIGRAVKRDSVLVKITGSDGTIGYGESHHARAANIIAQIVNTVLCSVCIGRPVDDVVGLWDAIYRVQLKSHGLGAATSMAMSGIDMALWDLRAKAAGMPLYRLLGGGPRAIPAYAGGVSLGWQAPEALVEEASPLIAQGYKAVKLRVGDSPAADIARVSAVRAAFGDALVILVDANTEYTLDDVRAVTQTFEELGVGWLEEPFPPHDHRRYAAARQLTRIPLAAGENHYTRFEFQRVVEDGVISILQPDLSKTGGITEGLRIAALGSAWKLPINPHSSLTGLNMAATIHFLASIDNGGYFEADVSRGNLFREGLTSRPYVVAADGTVRPNEAPGIGVAVDEAFAAAHPFIEGPAFVDIIR